MKPEEILRKAENPSNVPGIYNYCDQWCEHCAFTSRCLHYQMNAERNSAEAEIEGENQDFQTDMENMFEDTFKLIQYIAEKEGIDLNEVMQQATEREIEGKQAGYKTNAEIHPAAKLAETCLKLTDDFFESEISLFEQKEDELNTRLDLGLSENKVDHEAEDITRTCEIIQWYKTQVWIKIMRALQAKAEESQSETTQEPELQKDSDGSAKVALLGIDRSLKAWARMQELFPEKTDTIITVLVNLDRLRNMVETEFPWARKFKRPGFDD